MTFFVYVGNNALGKQTLSSKKTLPSAKIGTSDRDAATKVRAAVLFYSETLTNFNQVHILPHLINRKSSQWNMQPSGRGPPVGTCSVVHNVQLRSCVILLHSQAETEIFKPPNNAVN